MIDSFVFNYKIGTLNIPHNFLRVSLRRRQKPGVGVIFAEDALTSAMKKIGRLIGSPLASTYKRPPSVPTTSCDTVGNFFLLAWHSHASILAWWEKPEFCLRNSFLSLCVPLLCTITLRADNRKQTVACWLHRLMPVDLSHALPLLLYRRRGRNDISGHIISRISFWMIGALYG